MLGVFASGEGAGLFEIYFLPPSVSLSFGCLLAGYFWALNIYSFLVQVFTSASLKGCICLWPLGLLNESYYTCI